MLSIEVELPAIERPEVPKPAAVAIAMIYHFAARSRSYGDDHRDRESGDKRDAETNTTQPMLIDGT